MIVIGGEVRSVDVSITSPSISSVAASLCHGNVTMSCFFPVLLLTTYIEGRYVAMHCAGRSDELEKGIYC